MTCAILRGGVCAEIWGGGKGIILIRENGVGALRTPAATLKNGAGGASQGFPFVTCFVGCEYTS